MRFSVTGLVAAAYVSALLIAVPAIAQSVENGEDIFKKCRVCHDVGPDAKIKVGPPLRGIFGRKAGTADGFNYSDAMREAGAKGLVWSEETIGKYLDDPRAFIPGNKMAFAGVKDEADRKDLLAYLKSAAQ